MRFYYLYKALAHPELDGYVGPVTLEERLMHVKEARRVIPTAIPWLTDTMANGLKHALGDSPNMEYIIDPEGKVAERRAWSDPDELRADLARLAGPSERVTQVEELGVKLAERPRHAPTGIVPRLDLPDRAQQFRALLIEPQLDKTNSPFYVKLRAEADRALLRDGKGRLYLGFHLDPLYGVHWNNLVAPVEYEWMPTEGASIAPAKATGPKVAAEADADPREFLATVELGESRPSATLKFRYYACTDTFCKAVTQEYLVHWTPDRDGGRTQQRPAGGQGRPGPGSDPFSRFDRDGDGKLSAEEVPPPMRQRFPLIDANSDGFVDREEMRRFRQAGQR
ncbi:MAG: EF-hand domain-containing protein [Bryobacteraceae bacterium]